MHAAERFAIVVHILAMVAHHHNHHIGVGIAVKQCAGDRVLVAGAVVVICHGFFLFSGQFPAPGVILCGEITAVFGITVIETHMLPAHMEQNKPVVGILAHLRIHFGEQTFIEAVFLLVLVVDQPFRHFRIREEERPGTVPNVA